MYIEDTIKIRLIENQNQFDNLNREIREHYSLEYDNGNLKKPERFPFIMVSNYDGEYHDINYRYIYLTSIVKRINNMETPWDLGPDELEFNVIDFI